MCNIIESNLNLRFASWINVQLNMRLFKCDILCVFNILYCCSFSSVRISLQTHKKEQLKRGENKSVQNS